MRYLIIGLGIYGTNLAKDLTQLGHEVIGADIRTSNVDAIKDSIATAYIIDSTEESELYALPLKNVDLVIVAIGENFGASVKTVALLRKLGVTNLYARAIDELHAAILAGLNVKRILKPEQRAAHDLVNEMELGPDVAALRTDRNRMVMRFEAPEAILALHYADLTPEKLCGFTLVAAARPTPSVNLLGVKSTELLPIDTSDPSQRVDKGDVVTLLGDMKAYKALSKPRP